MVANKIDLLNRDEIQKRLDDFQRTDKEIIPISAYTGENLEYLVNKMWDLIK